MRLPHSTWPEETFFELALFMCHEAEKIWLGARVRMRDYGFLKIIQDDIRSHKDDKFRQYQNWLSLSNMFLFSPLLWEIVFSI